MRYCELDEESRDLVLRFIVVSEYADGGNTILTGRYSNVTC